MIHMKMKTRAAIAFAAVLMMVTKATAQDGFKWFDPQGDEMQVVEGQAFPDECRGIYMRLPDARREKMPAGVASNAVHSTGLTLRFHSDAPEIWVRYITTYNWYSMPHMPSTGMSGLDLYATDKRGHSMICRGVYNFADTVSYRYYDLAYHDDGGYDYELFLPLYNGVKWMEIGVPEGAQFRFLPASKAKPVLVYGTSIAHGGCASRPAMAWSSIVKRDLHLPLINWGFSGSGLMEPEVFDMMTEVDARLFIIDCMPNMVGMPDQIVTRMTAGVKKLREKSNAPILIVEHDGYPSEETNNFNRDEYQRANQECLKAYKQLVREGVKNIWYLSHEEIAMDPDGMVDCVHSTDLGMAIYAKAYTKKIRQILQLKK